MSPIRAAYESAADRLNGLSFDDFSRALDRCEVHPVEVLGKTAGAIVVSGAEVHACVLPWARGLWLSKRMLRVLGGVIQKHGYALTTATTEEGRQFVERLGFFPDGPYYKKVA